MQYFSAAIDECCAQLGSGEIDRADFIERCVLIISSKIGCTRAGLWVFIETGRGRRMRCLGVYDRGAGRVLIDPDREEHDAGDYFRELERVGHVMATDVHTHPATRRFFGSRQRQLGIASVMAASFSLNGRLFGAFTCSQDEPRQWSARELAMLSRIASRVTLALAGSRTGQFDSLLGGL